MRIDQLRINQQPRRGTRKAMTWYWKLCLIILLYIGVGAEAAEPLCIESCGVSPRGQEFIKTEKKL